MKKSLCFAVLTLLVFFFCQSYKGNEIVADSNSGISSIELSPQKIEDLSLLGKVWGFVKYYHPLVASGKLNWDNELFKKLPEIISCKNANERNSILLSWINNLGKLQTGALEKMDGSEIKMSSDFSWMNAATIGDSLFNELSLVKNAKRKDKNFYVELGEAGNATFSKEISYKESPFPDAGLRLLSLYRYWNVIQYFYPYKYLFKENWNDALPEFIPKFVNAKNELEYKLAILQLIGRLHDTHAVVDDSTITNYIGANYAPIELQYVEDKFIVAGFLDKQLGAESGLQKGDVIVSVNQKTIDQIMQEKLVYSSASNDVVKFRNIAEEMLRSNDTLMSVTYMRGNVVQSTTVHCYPHSRINMRMKYQRNDTCFKMLAPDIAYIYAGSIKNKYLESVMPDFMKTKAIVIDLRCYPREFIPFTLGRYLWTDQSIFASFTRPDIKTPGFFTFQKTYEGVGKKNDNCYKGKVIILVNEISQSQAEYTAMAFRHVPGSIVIGSTTAGADGNVSSLVLPSGITTRFSGLGVYYPDRKETQQVGIVPDIEVKPTIAGITAGRDEVLEKAIEVINRK